VIFRIPLLIKRNDRRQSTKIIVYIIYAIQRNFELSIHRLETVTVRLTTTLTLTTCHQNKPLSYYQTFINSTILNPHKPKLAVLHTTCNHDERVFKRLTLL